MSWSSPRRGPCHCAAKIDNTDHYPDPSRFYEHTTEKMKSDGNATTKVTRVTSATHRVYMSILDRDYAETQKADATTCQDLVYTVFIEPV